MTELGNAHSQNELESFSLKLFSDQKKPSVIGSGALGGKARGLIGISKHLAISFDAELYKEIEFNIPSLAVILSDVFDTFIQENQVSSEMLLEESDDRIAHAFQNFDLPFGILGDLRAIVDQIHYPLAVRSSSILEDALESPFAGIYATKMIPNNESDTDVRFRKLTEAIKYVYASTFFKAAKDYRKAIGKDLLDEKMAVIIQEVVGKPHFDRYYPDISGVARSFNYYPPSHSKPEDGIVNLALGLGKTIVDGEPCWWFIPKSPRANPPFLNVSEWLKQTQNKFWSVNLGPPPSYDPINESEYLIKCGLKEAEYDDTLRSVVSTYDPRNDRINVGLGEVGPRLVTFAPILVYNQFPLNDLLKNIMSICEEALNSPVEIEFALTLSPTRFGLLQVRPLLALADEIEIEDDEFNGKDILLASERVLGNGESCYIEHVVFVKPQGFEAKHTPQIAREIEAVNTTAIENGTNYLLIGFGRWGSSDPWLGTPVSWGQISQAKTIVESTLPEMDKEFSQGSHFFHNITSFGVSYFSVRHSDEHALDWEWLDKQLCIIETDYIKYVKLERPLTIKVDGRNGRGVITK
ncbi:MAG: PEP/pyruvate-binding domain-containing protein [Candidatus Marinimicrobia bacterium]|nr:PEP/pyruvate-binding domain-containing protein [Candidatus Neomarinimicrobiota bacterium]